MESVSRLASTALEHAMMHEQTKAISQTDSLTGLPNGRALYARFDQVLAEANQLGTPLTILCFNIAGLRTVNESFGYQAGDGVLAEAAKAQEQIGLANDRTNTHVGLSFGIAEFPTDGRSIVELLSVAALETRQNKTAIKAQAPGFSTSKGSGSIALIS